MEPLSLQQVLGRAWLAMAEQEQREQREADYQRAYRAYQHGRPVVKIRRPRKKLRAWLAGR